MTTKMKMLIAAGALVVAAGTAPAQARSFTTTPEATMHEQQKLGPNEVTTQLWGGGFVTERIGEPRNHMFGPAYGYAHSYGPAYGSTPDHGPGASVNW